VCRWPALPIAGQAAALAITVADIAEVVDDGNPIRAAGHDPLGYAIDVTQVGADVSTTGCAVAPSTATCGTAVATNLLALELRGWRRDALLPFPVPPGILVVARPSQVEHLARTGEHVAAGAAHRLVDGVTHTARDAARDVAGAWHALPGLLR
jgi:hypothetical protein